MSLPPPYFSRDAKHSYKSPSHGRHELLLLKSFSQKATRSYIKAILLQGTTISYKSPFLRRYSYFLHKALLLEGTTTSYLKPFSQKAHMLYTKALFMEGNSNHNFTTIRRALLKGKLISVHDKRGKLNQSLHTARHTLSPSSCTHFFPSILKLSQQTASLPLELLCWDIISSQKLYSQGYKSYKDK